MKAVLMASRPSTANGKAGKFTSITAMKQLGMKPNTFYRRAKEIEAERIFNNKSQSSML